MPQMSGRELAEQVAALGLKSKVLFMSGYTSDAIVHHGVLEAGTWFIQKPFSPQALVRKVREVLDSDRPAIGDLQSETETIAVND
jgi:FixJ family two-component response regulator